MCYERIGISKIDPHLTFVELPYKSPFQPYPAWTTLFAVSLVIIFSGISAHLFCSPILTSNFRIWYLLPRQLQSHKSLDQLHQYLPFLQASEIINLYSERNLLAYLQCSTFVQVLLQVQTRQDGRYGVATVACIRLRMERSVCRAVGWQESNCIQETLEQQYFNRPLLQSLYGTGNSIISRFGNFSPKNQNSSAQVSPSSPETVQVVTSGGASIFLLTHLRLKPFKICVRWCDELETLCNKLFHSFANSRSMVVVSSNDDILITVLLKQPCGDLFGSYSEKFIQEVDLSYGNWRWRILQEPS
jgi:hypothetical protein